LSTLLIEIIRLTDIYSIHLIINSNHLFTSYMTKLLTQHKNPSIPSSPGTRYCFFLANLFVSFILNPISAQEANDTVVRNLQEVTVKSSSQTISAKSATYFPSSKAKKAAINAIDLLQRMAINQIVINPVTKEVSTTAKENVAIFINNSKATQADIDGLKTTDVKKVEYLDFPTDPRFMGLQHVINIVTPKYEYGGYTKISDSQEVISRFENKGSVFSKFIYKRMTFDAYIGANFLSSSHFGSSNDSRFELADGTVTRNEQMTSGKQRQFDLPITFRATYDRKNMQIENTVGFMINNTRCQETEGRLTLSPGASVSDYDFRTSAPAITRSLSWRGGYYFVLPKAWSIYVIPSFAYSHINSHSCYSTNVPDSKPIDNNAREDAYNVAVNANAYKTFNNRHSLSMHLDYRHLINNIDYYGSSPSHSDNSGTTFTASANYSYNKNNKLVVNLNAGAGGSISKVNGIKQSSYFPFSTIYLSFAPTTKSQFQLTANCASNAVNSFMRSTNVLQINELLFRTGNPKLKNYQSLLVNGSYTYFPCNELTLQAFVRYFGCYDRLVNNYSPFDDGKYVVESTINSGDFNRLNAGINLTGRLFSNKLVIQASPGFSRSVSSGYYDMARNNFSWSINAQYYFGDFNLTAYYQSREYYMGLITGDNTWNSSYYTLQIGWAREAWNVSFSAKNFLRSDYNSQWSDLSSPFYTKHTSFYLPSYHSALNLTATYTFGYGKKIRRGNEVNAQWGAESAIMK